jgi:hypothetical protein
VCVWGTYFFVASLSMSTSKSYNVDSTLVSVEILSFALLKCIVWPFELGARQ